MGDGRLLAGRYRVLGMIGRGGMGAVWRARDLELDRVVAVKELRLPEEIGEDERGVLYARLGREARVAARLRHPGIVTAYDRVTGSDGRPLIVMELVEGPSLDDVLRDQGALPVGRVADIGRQMLDALAAAHAQGVVHRDVKPANVLLEGARVVLTDFGIAAVEGDATLTKTGTILGTPAYMAPEQIRGGDVTPRADLWALGATLYAAVEGRPPFSGSTHGAVYVAIVTEDPPAPAKAGPLTEVLTGLLRKDPAARLTPDAVRDLLTPLAVPPRPAHAATPEPPPLALAAPRPAAPPPGAPPAVPPAASPAAPLPGAPPAGAPPAGAPPAGGQSAGAPSPSPLGAPPAGEPPAGAPTAMVPGAPGGRPTRVLPGSPRRGRTVAVVAGAVVVLAVVVGIAVRATSGGDGAAPAAKDRTIVAHRGPVGGLAFSPDGTSLASTGTDHTTRIWNTATGRQSSGAVPTGAGSSPYQAAFSPDGNTVATDDRNGDIELFDPAIRRITGLLRDPDELPARSVAFSKDGKYLAVGVGGTDPADNSVRIWDLAARQITHTISGIAQPVTALAFSGLTLAYGNGPDIRLWDMSGKTGTATIPSSGTVGAVAFSPDGALVAGSGTGADVRIWRTKPLGAVRSIPAGAGGQVAFGPDNTTVAVRAADSPTAIRLWNARTGKSVRTLTGLPAAVGPIAFSRDGRYVAGGDAKGDVRMWALG